MTRALVRLLRLKLSLLNGIAAVGGYLLFPAAIELPGIVAAFIGVTLLAAGGSALNQVLERDLDIRMARTRLRPLPMGQMTPVQGAAVGTSVLLAGLLLLFSVGGMLPALLGTVALFWYLAVYTPLKRRTSLALPVGALCGAFPPLIGWCLADGVPTDYRIIILAGLLFIWQIPHFWLLQERHEADYRRAGIPLVATRQGLLGLWIVALTAAALMLPAFGLIDHPAALWYAAFPVPMIFLALMRSRTLLFTYLNLFPVLLTLVLFFSNCV